MPSFRAFIAVDLAPMPALAPFLTELSGVRGLKPVDVTNLHVTLKFLGDTDESLVPQIEEAMRSACAGVPPFEIQVTGSGVFPPKGGARVVWAGLRGAEPLAGIAARLERSLESLGFPPEGRAFKPHLTLARVKDPSASSKAREIAASFVSSEFARKRVGELLLKKSVLRPQGPEYSDVASVPLDG